MSNLLNYLWITWLFGFPIYYSLFYDIIRYRRAMIKTTFKLINPEHIVFQITTVGGMRIVQDSINRIHEVCKMTNYTDYEIHVVTEANESFIGAESVVVPTNYRTRNDVKFKARALQYATDFRRWNNLASMNNWTFHLDDESMITEQCLRAILDHIDSHGPPISEGLITYPNKWNVGSKLIKYLDSVRPTFCYQCFSMLKIKGNPIWLHGSNLLVRGDVEDRIGWDRKDSRAEDALFGIVAYEAYGKSAFGWHGGIIEEQSPFTLKDFIKQRQRWIAGTFQNIKHMKHTDRAKAVYRLLSWSIGGLASLATIFALVIPQTCPLVIVPFLLFDTFILYYMYWEGLRMNRAKMHMKDRMKDHIAVLFLTQLLMMLEALPMVLYFIRGMRESAFYVVQK